MSKQVVFQLVLSEAQKQQLKYIREARKRKQDEKSTTKDKEMAHKKDG